jgi:acyl carrier protein
MYAEEKFVGVLMEQFGVELDKLSEDTNLREDLGADETDLAELLMALEECLDIEVSDAQWKGVTTIESAVDLIYDIKNSRYW